MAKAAWKRPGSPIGQKGPRKPNPKYKRRSGQPWTIDEVKELKTLAKGNTPTALSALSFSGLKMRSGVRHSANGFHFDRSTGRLITEGLGGSDKSNPSHIRPAKIGNAASDSILKMTAP